AGATVMILYLIGLFIFSLALLPLKVIAAMRRLDVELKISVIAAVVNVALNFLLIPLWGMNGSALATLVSFTIMTVLAFWYSKKLFNFDFPKSSLLPLFSAVLAFLLLYLSRQYLLDFTAKIPLDWLAAQLGGIEPEMMQKILKLIVFGVLFIVACTFYFGILIVSRSFGKEELDIIHKGMRRMKIPEKYIYFFLHFLGGKPGANAF
ncbi:MAG: polysaccharide biosynthesis C-terminal domain-containing protein, partial [Candidatus Micrarchaeota archaeon]